MGKLEVGLLYVSLHNQLSRRASKDGMVEKKEFFCIIGKHFLIPKNLRPVIIKEMEKRNLVKQELSGNIRILNCEINMETDVSKLYELCGLF